MKVGDYQRTWNTFEIDNKKFLIKTTYWKPTIKQLKPWKHITTLFKVWDNEYLGDELVNTKTNNWLITKKVKKLFKMNGGKIQINEYK